MYESGTLVWVKMRGYPLWPGRIQPDRVNNLYKQGNILVEGGGVKDGRDIHDEA